jgi:hypothetical protein
MMSVTPGKFEEAIIKIARVVLDGHGQFLSHQRLGTLPSGRPWNVDVLFFPRAGLDKDRPFILEIKFSRTPTLPQATFLSVLQEFDSIRESNPTHNPRFALVTNGRIPYKLETRVARVEVWDGVIDEQVWRARLSTYLLEVGT